MKPSFVKTILASVIPVCLVIGCSKTNPSNAAGNPPQFHLTANDLASPAEVATNKTGTIVVRFKLNETKAGTFYAFTKAHLNQQVAVVIGSQVIAQPVIRSVISNGEIEESFGSSASKEAHATTDLLSGK